jgi:hypothetical protein
LTLEIPGDTVAAHAGVPAPDDHQGDDDALPDPVRDTRRGACARLGLAAPAQAQNTIKVGTIFPLSGGAGPQGQHVTKAIETMAAMMNDAGGVLGRKLEIVSRDDESTPAVGVSRADELVSAGVSVVIEGWNSPVTLAMQPVLSRAGVLDITAISKADPILSGEGNPLAIRLNSSNSQDGAVVASYIANVAKAKPIASSRRTTRTATALRPRSRRNSRSSTGPTRRSPRRSSRLRRPTSALRSPTCAQPTPRSQWRSMPTRARACRR